MNKSPYILILSVLLIEMSCSFNRTTATNGDYLFSIGGEKHFADEFNYAFAKNNEASENSMDSINNYLDLYVNFRLKVKAAKEAGYDTTASFKKEFDQYKNQLDNSYLAPKKEQEALIKEAYERNLWEIKAAHILVKLSHDALPEDTLKAYNKILSIRKRVQEGEDFNTLARQVSDDPSAKSNGGELGYFSVLQMVYPFENAAYNTAVGDISMPVRTKFGYHIIKVEDKRKNVGKVQVAHIMIRSTAKNSEEFRANAKDKIYRIDSLLKSGGEWNKLCKAYSEDPNSVHNNGLLSPFGRGQIVPEFENAAFQLSKPGELSNPVQTQFGWHIIKLVKQIPIGSYEEERENLVRKVNRDSRSSMPHAEMIEKLKAKNDFKRNEGAINELHNLSRSYIKDGKWNFSAEQKNDTAQLFTLPNKSVSVGSFLTSLEKVGISNNKSISDEIKAAITHYEDTLITNCEKKHLAESYPEYKFLLNEYYDGILLFSIMEDSVWNQSMGDSLGLEMFYKKHINQFTKNVRDSLLFTSDQESIVRSVSAKYSKEVENWDDLKTKLLEEYNISPLNLHVVSKKEPIWDKIRLKANEVNNGPFELDGRWYLLEVGDKKMEQPLENVKGRVIAEYQTYLDNQWIERLRKKYPVEISKKQLKTVYAHFKADN